MNEILLFNYWEHIKAEKELALVLPPEHTRRIAIRTSAEELLAIINPLK